MSTTNLSRKVLIYLSKNGVFVFARKGTKRHSEYTRGLSFLPCASVNTLHEAELLQVHTCRLSYDGKLFKLNSFDGTLEGLEQAGAELERLYLESKGKR